MLVKTKGLVAVGCVLSIVSATGCASQTDLKTACAARDRLAGQLTDARRENEELVQKDQDTQSQLMLLSEQTNLAAKTSDDARTAMIVAQAEARASTLAAVSARDEAARALSVTERMRLAVEQAQGEARQSRAEVERMRVVVAQAKEATQQAVAEAEKMRVEAGRAQSETRLVREEATARRDELMRAQAATESDAQKYKGLAVERAAALDAQARKLEAVCQQAQARATDADRLSDQLTKARQEQANAEASARAAITRAEASGKQLTDLRAQVATAARQIEGLKQEKAKLQAAAAKVAEATTAEPGSSD